MTNITNIAIIAIIAIIIIVIVNQFLNVIIFAKSDINILLTIDL